MSSNFYHQQKNYDRQEPSEYWGKKHFREHGFIEDYYNEIDDIIEPEFDDNKD
jgi:hypothetical protein